MPAGRQTCMALYAYLSLLPSSVCSFLPFSFFFFLRLVTWLFRFLPEWAPLCGTLCVCHPSFLGVSFQACKGTGHHWHCCPTKRVSVGAEAVEDAPLCTCTTTCTYRITEGNGSRRTVYVGSFPSVTPLFYSHGVIRSSRP